MPVSDGFVEFVCDQLSQAGPIAWKRMFGGVGIYAGDLFFALISGDERLYLKVDDTNRGDFDAAGTGPFMPYGDAREIMQYYEVPLPVLEDADELARWARKAIAVAAAKRAKPSRPAARRRPSARKPKRAARRRQRQR